MTKRKSYCGACGIGPQRLVARCVVIGIRDARVAHRHVCAGCAGGMCSVGEMRKRLKRFEDDAPLTISDWDAAPIGGWR